MKILLEMIIIIVLFYLDSQLVNLFVLYSLYVQFHSTLTYLCPLYWYIFFFIPVYFQLCGSRLLTFNSGRSLTLCSYYMWFFLTFFNLFRLEIPILFCFSRFFAYYWSTCWHQFHFPSVSSNFSPSFPFLNIFSFFRL